MTADLVARLESAADECAKDAPLLREAASALRSSGEAVAWPVGVLNREATIRTLTEHNAWRRGANTPQTDPVMLGKALDAAIAALESFVRPHPASQHEATRSLGCIGEGMNKWLPIESAPMDGRPVWVRGNNWGRSDGGFHHGWAYFDEGMWRWPEASGEESGNATYLTHWFPFTAPTGATP